jgi:hypothetical protein
VVAPGVVVLVPPVVEVLALFACWTFEGTKRDMRTRRTTKATSGP